MLDVQNTFANQAASAFQEDFDDPDGLPIMDM
jgi:hypothetical protein